MKYRYLRGAFRSQFRLVEDETSDSSLGKRIYNVELEQKFQLFSAVEISKDEFDSQAVCVIATSECKCLIHEQPGIRLHRLTQKEELEVYSTERTQEGRLCVFDDILIFYTAEALISDVYPGGFYSNEIKSGKFSGEAFVRICESDGLLKEVLDARKNPSFQVIDSFNSQLRNGRSVCFSSPGKPLWSFGALFGGDNLAGLGCFHRPLPFGCFSPMGGPRTLAGCFQAGVQTGGCFRLGWQGRLLGLLGVLGLVLLLLSQLQTCNQPRGENVVVIHDTVVVEVIKERVDTLEIIRIDTTKLLQKSRVQNTDLIALPNVQFETGKDILLPGSLPDIQQLAEFLKKNAHINADVMGHTDSIGVFNQNLELSRRRALAVKEFLVRLGVESKRVSAEGYGSTRPKAPNSTLEGRMLNRRVEVKLTNTLVVTEETVVIE